MLTLLICNSHLTLSIKNQIFLADNFEDAWEGVLVPWLEHAHPTSCNSKPHALIVPYLSTAIFIKQAWAKLNRGCWNIHFLTPGTLRQLIGEHTTGHPPVALREHLRLVLSVAIEQLPHNKTAQSLKHQPDAFLKLYDELASAGWASQDFPTPALQELASTFSRYLKAAELWTLQQYDTFLVQEPSQIPELFETMLYYGLGAEHMNTFKLLRAGLSCARRTTLCFLNSTLDLHEEAWLGTWEELLGPATPLPSASCNEKPFKAWQCALESGFPSPNEAAPILRIHESPHHEAQVLVTQALQFMQQPSCDRLGIVFPSQNCSLANSVAHHLNQQGIPYYDHIGHADATEPEYELLEFWKTLQKEPKLDSLLRFIECLYHYGKLKSSSVEIFKKRYHQAFFELMTDELSVLNAYVKIKNTPSDIHRFWENYPLLPTQASFETLYEQSQNSLSQILSSETLDIINTHSLFFCKESFAHVDLCSFLSWLTAIVNPNQQTKSPQGSHPFSRIHLICANEAVLQSWSHLIVAGLQENMWSAHDQEIPLLNEETLSNYNRASLKTGSQGEGHLTLKENHTLISPPSRLNNQRKSHLAVLIGMPSAGLALSASLKNHHQNNPLSHWIIQLFYLQRNLLLTPDLLATIQQYTQSWYQSTNLFLNNPEQSNHEATLIAYKARRDKTKAFGPYEFSFQTPPPNGLILPCKSWEDALLTPTKVWFRNILKTKKNLCAKQLSVNALVHGTWSHRWLLWDEANGRFAPNSKLETWTSLVIQKAQLTYADAQKAYQSAGRELPQYWVETWKKAHRSAHSLLKAIAQFSEWPFIAMEYPITSPANSILKIPLHGQIDLIYSRDASGKTPCWLFDFKTGNQDNFTLHNLKRGKNLQLALYILALSHEAPGDTGGALLQPGKVFKKIVTQKELLELKTLFEGLEAIHKTGILGVRGPFKSGFGPLVELPWATLDIPETTLATKWALTHPNLAY